MTLSYLLILLAAWILLNIIFVVGSFLSRFFSLNIAYLSLFATLFYTGIGYVGALYFDNTTGVVMSGILGLYEAVFAIKIMHYCKADLGSYLKELQPVLDDNNYLHPLIVLLMLLMYMFLGWLGTLML